MKPPQLPSGRRRGIPFILPDDWTPEQALAVVELLDDLRAVICNHYALPLHELMREIYGPSAPDEAPTIGSDEPPF
jgi:hypothetical protein